MDQCYGEWVPYSGNGAIILGVALLLIAGVFALCGVRLRNPLGVKMPGKAVGGTPIVLWVLSILTFLVNIQVCSILLDQANFTGTVPVNPITKFTLSFGYSTGFLVLNVVSKALAFVVVVTLFLPEHDLAP